MRMVGTIRRAIRKIHEIRKYSIRHILAIVTSLFIPFLDFLPDIVVDESTFAELVGGQRERALHFTQTGLPNSRNLLIAFDSTFPG